MRAPGLPRQASPRALRRILGYADAMRDLTFGRVRVVIGAQNGKYPHGNSLWIEGEDATAVIDPSLSVHARSAEFRNRADLALLSHVHEDHVAGLGAFPAARVCAHAEDIIGLQSLDGLMQIYGISGAAADAMRTFVTESFHYAPRPDAEGFTDGAVFDLGGSRVRVIHAPGHTRGHSLLLVEPEGVLFLGDIELSSFGPYYGDAWSDLADFERSIELVRRVDAQVWVSFHHVGVLTDRTAFLARLDRFAARIGEREAAMHAYLAEPHSLDELVAHRFLYPAHVTLPFIDAVERRTLEQHLARMQAAGRVTTDADGRWRAIGAP